jgi:hypothetical protein
VFLFAPISAKYYALLIFPDPITFIIYDEECGL